GTADAYRVRVVDTLNLKMPVYQFKMIGASHSYKLTHSNNVVTWVFDNINLKPKSVDEEASKGALVFEAYVRGGLGIGDSIINNASIFFDLNEPIRTNNSVVVRTDSNTSLKPILNNTGINIYPNPGQQSLTIENE